MTQLTITPTQLIQYAGLLSGIGADVRDVVEPLKAQWDALSLLAVPATDDEGNPNEPFYSMWHDQIDGPTRLSFQAGEALASTVGSQTPANLQQTAGQFVAADAHAAGAAGALHVAG
jgi:hypothetical protein